jgi:hypothetical protein
MISNIDPVELENVLRPTIYRPAGSEPERSGGDRLSADKAAPAPSSDDRGFRFTAESAEERFVSPQRPQRIGKESFRGC